jgi:hypothetical protein
MMLWDITMSLHVYEVVPADRSKSALTTSFGVVLFDNALIPIWSLFFYARNMLGMDPWA